MVFLRPQLIPIIKTSFVLLLVWRKSHYWFLWASGGLKDFRIVSHALVHTHTHTHTHRSMNLTNKHSYLSDDTAGWGRCAESKNLTCSHIHHSNLEGDLETMKPEAICHSITEESQNHRVWKRSLEKRDVTSCINILWNPEDRWSGPCWKFTELQRGCHCQSWLESIKSLVGNRRF